MRAHRLLLCLLLSILTVGKVFAQIRADITAPVTQRPVILSAPNGVPLVNIQTPTAAGVSRNSYSQFDVGSVGAIVNNSRTDTPTQLGGWVQGNPWLADGSARIILNEVNSNHPSYLHGWIEVAGQPAQLITANPAGITCNGCGFIHATHATLVTGKPLWQGEAIEGYQVSGGQLRIEGLGMDGRQSEAVSLLSRSAAINAGIWARRLNAVTGSNHILVDDSGHPADIRPLTIAAHPDRAAGSENASSAPVLALDVSHLGGMYADHIFLIGTEHGLGVRQAGTLHASQQLVLGNDGWLRNEGSVLGETLSLQAGRIENDGTIAARDDLALGVGELHNRDNALILSDGDLSIGRQLIMATDPSTGQRRLVPNGEAELIRNDAATIEVAGNARIGALAFNNRNTHLTLAQVPEAPFSVQRLQVAGTEAVYLASQCGPLRFSGLRLRCVDLGRSHTFEDYTLFNLTGRPSRSQIRQSTPALLRVGGDLHIRGDGTVASQVNNQDSQIVVGGDIILNDTALNNYETKGSYQVQYSGTAEFTTVEHCGGLFGGHCRRWHGQFGYQPAPEVTTIDLPTGLHYAANNSTAPSTVNDIPGASTGAANALFKLASHPDSPGGYLIETDPRFVSHQAWLSSDYLLQGLALDPVITQKRLGDGFYEQGLIRDQVAQLTGRRFLPGYTDDEVQYLALMDAGKTVARTLRLRPGIALAPEQVAQLTSDIVWLVEESVKLPDGKATRVLVPRVYVRVREGDLQANGTLISGRSITAKLSSDLTNSGLITADQTLSINAEAIHNLAGRMDGRAVQLHASGDINILGGRITATDHLQLHADHDLTLQSTTQTTETRLYGADANRGSRFSRTQIDQIAGVSVTGSDDHRGIDNVTHRPASSSAPTLSLSAGRNVTMSAARIDNTSAGVTTIAAGEHLTLSTVTTEQDELAVKDAKNHSHIARRTEVGTQITTTGALNLGAAQDLTLHAATVDSGGAVDLHAGHDVRIEAGRAEHLNDQARQTSKRGTFSRTTTTTRDVFEDTVTLVTTLSGQRVDITAGNDLTVRGSHVVADQDVNLTAAQDLQIVAEANSYTEDHDHHQKKSGVFGSGGAGVTVGTRSLSVDQQNTRTSSSASVVGSLGGDLHLHAGHTYTQTGSDLVALQAPHTGGSGGHVTINGGQVDITEAREISRTETETRFRQSGVTVAVSAPLITAAQTVDRMARAASQTADARMQALAAANVAMAVDQATDAVRKNPDQLGGLNLSISAGKSNAQSHSTLITDTGVSSRLSATNDIAITATKDDLRIQGSQISAGQNINLSANDQIRLEAAPDSAEQHSTNSQRGASVGIGFAVGTRQAGINLNLAATQGQGYADGSDVRWVNAEVTAGHQVRSESGSDTTIRGGVVSAPRVQASTGVSGSAGSGNLTIESLQDTSRYASEQELHGGSLSVPITGARTVTGSVNAADSEIHSDYASVTQQSGIRAGDGGFQVSVKGDVTLRGGTITSTQYAVNQGRNTLLNHGALAATDVENRMTFDATGTGIQLGAGYSPAGSFVLPGSGVGIGEDSDRQQGTTYAAISTVAGNRAARTGDREDGLVNTFDAERVQQEIAAQVRITQQFAQQAGSRVSDYAQSQRRDLQEQMKNTNSEEKKKALQEKINSINHQERIMNVMIGAVTGFGGVMLMKESLSTAADQMRQLMIEESRIFRGVTDGKTVLSNVSGPSDGVRGDGVKVGGTRVDLDLLCGSENQRCERNSDKSLKLNPDGYVVFNNTSFEEFMKTPDGEKMIGPTGGVQGKKGQLFGWDYAAGSWQDKLVEAFSGTHDMIGGRIAGLYDDQGNIKRGMSEFERNSYDKAVTVMAIIPSTPFAMAELLPSEVWKAISIFLQAAR